MRFLSGYKTYVVVWVSLIFGITGWLIHRIDGGTAFQIVQGALLGGFIRNGIKSDLRKPRYEP